MKRFLLWSFAVIVLGALGAAAFFLNTFHRFAETPFGSGAPVVEIPAGSGPHATAALLKKNGVVSDANLFVLYVRHFRHAGALLKHGEYAFALPMTPDQVIDKLVAGDVVQHRITLPEGLRIDEMAPIFEASGLCSELTFSQLVRNPNLARKWNIDGDSLEGWIFPDTYSFTKGESAETFLGSLVARAKRELAAARTVAPSTLSDREVMTLASIVEKETAQPEERPRVSCVFHNRLQRGIKLQTDPTVIYAKLLRLGSFDGNITKGDLVEPHPYNTYTVKGLPPGPIASPGVAAIRAALAPLACDDLFFVSKNDGTHVFCPDLACHEANVRKWQIDYFRRQHAANR